MQTQSFRPTYAGRNNLPRTEKMEDKTPLLILKNLSVNITGKKILKNIDFTFHKNKIYAIMGPNGSGKSTLAYTIMGNPSYVLEKNSSILYKNKEIQADLPDKRAKNGIFLSFQNPLSLSGVNVFQLLRLALSGIKDPLTVKEEIEKYAGLLKIDLELTERSLNDGASGGEKKKLELLQAAVLNPDLQIFDEIDTGVDVDALKIIAGFIKQHKHNKTYIIITHYNRILKYIRPDVVMVMIDGKIAKTGDYRLAETIEKKGYEKLRTL